MTAITELDDDVLVSTYIRLRDREDAMEKAHKAALEPIDKAMLQIETELASRLNARKSQNTKTPSGTAFFDTVSSVTTADKMMFRDFVIARKLWDIIDWRPAKTASIEFLEHEKTPPPGVNIVFTRKVKVRKS